MTIIQFESAKNIIESINKIGNIIEAKKEVGFAGLYLKTSNHVIPLSKEFKVPENKLPELISLLEKWKQDYQNQLEKI